ncbi:BrxA family protein [Oribacterium sp. P6A1]|uniref:BrxA family protein n=1 Tax=Oribacterium sp. P6A1 TaxID=1410612 RepID=UPI00068F36F9|nr:BrxA family protein [Oribacterium sp. P6A1]
MDDNLSDEEIISRIIEDNLFQFPTEKSLKRTVTGCLRRLRCLGDDELIKTVTHSSMEVGKQVCLNAMMKEYRLVWDFMITVIGAKYREQDLSYGRMDLNVFFMRLQAQHMGLATCWTGWYEQDEMRNLLGLTDKDYVTGIITVGYADENPDARQRRQPRFIEI